MRTSCTETLGYSADFFKGSAGRWLDQATWQGTVHAIWEQSQCVGHIVIEGAY
jgi:hypothetical protein